MTDIIQDYFINPIVEKSGYNIINTLIYAIIAILVAFLIYRKFKKHFTKELIIYTIPFILLGSTVRVITDATESGINWKEYTFYWLFGPFLESGIYDYGFLTVTPGIYVLVGSIAIISLYISIKLKRPMIYPLIGLILAVPHVILVLSMLKEFTYLTIILTFTLLFAIMAHLLLKRYSLNGIIPRFAVLAHILDGVSSFVAIEIFNRFSPLCVQQGICYFGQHVIERFLSEIITYGTVIYLFAKIAFAVFASYIIEKEAGNENERYFLYLLIIIFGLAPGLRNLLRIALGV
ncbi:MAG: DUF63 family protein [Candidatus Micrarchaeota archaeon]|nr:DUF63 family protein [Candidatus Micrarchaeota archaeon]